VRVRRAADRTAIIVGDDEVTYGELDARAEALAAALRRAAFGPEQLVGLCMERSVELVIAQLGVLKAGAAYLPLDPAQPFERLSFMVRDAGCRLVISSSALAPRLA